MDTASTTHPSASALEKFGLGIMDDASAEVVMNHLDVCPDCCRQVAGLSGDAFLARLRELHNAGSTPSPAQSLADVGGTRQAADSLLDKTMLPSLPAELAAN